MPRPNLSPPSPLRGFGETALREGWLAIRSSWRTMTAHRRAFGAMVGILRLHS